MEFTHFKNNSKNSFFNSVNIFNEIFFQITMFVKNIFLTKYSFILKGKLITTYDHKLLDLLPLYFILEVFAKVIFIFLLRELKLNY